jgi:hypothetical protein
MGAKRNAYRILEGKPEGKSGVRPEATIRCTSSSVTNSDAYYYEVPDDG